VTRVVLSRLEPGMYAVRRRRSEHWAGPLLVLETYWAWTVAYYGNHEREFPTLADCRVWLNSAEGQAFLDGVPRLGREDPT